MSVLVEPTDAKISSSFEAWDNNKITGYLFMFVIKSTINYYLIVASTRSLAKGNLLSEQEMKGADGLTVDFLNLVQEVDSYALSFQLF